MEKTDRELPRVGHWLRPDREWEIWNDNYHRDGSAREGWCLDAPWVAWHPRHGDFSLPTHEAAIRLATSFH